MDNQEEFRYEKKFKILQLEHYEIENLIKQNPAIFSEIFYERQVNNIYFDSLNFKNYYDNLSGNAQRIKIRIRWYGKMFGLVEKPVLELKIKSGFVGKKKSFKLKPFILNKTFDFDNLRKNVLKNSNLPMRILELFNLSKPILLNAYKRKYFISANRKIRITLDKDLEFFRIKEKNNLFIDKTFDKDLRILEIKSSAKYEDEISKITQYFPFRIAAISKYVYGINFLELS